MNKYLAFDLEISKIIDEAIPWEEQRPYGISCAATMKTGEEPRVWYGRGCPFKYAWNKMPMMQVRTLVQYLQQAVSDGYQIVTFNGLKFDFDVLAEESGMHEECVSLALDHLDMMFHFFCVKGHFVGLAKVAMEMGLEGKSGSGADAPRLWAAGEYQKILDYVAQDVAVTMNVFNEIKKKDLWGGSHHGAGLAALH